MSVSAAMPKENPENPSPSHYSNLKYQLAVMPLKCNESQTYNSSSLTKYYNLYDESEKTAAQQWKDQQYSFYH